MRSLWLALGLVAACGPAVEPGDSGADASTGDVDDSSGAPASESTDATASAGTAPGTTTDTPGTSSTTTAGTTTADPSTTTVDPGSTGSSDDGSSGDPPDFEPICAGDAELSFAVTGMNQAGEYEGRLVWGSAVEPVDEGSPDPIVVLQQDTIEGGVFDLACMNSMSENFIYPSVMVVIDADDDGVCSDGDVGWSQQLFGWSDDQIYRVDGSSLYADGDPEWLVTDMAWQPVGAMSKAWGVPVCEYYFG